MSPREPDEILEECERAEKRTESHARSALLMAIVAACGAYFTYRLLQEAAAKNRGIQS